MRTFITAFMLVATLGLVSCGGGNDVASTGASAVSAAAPVTSTTATEPKVNGQIDERTGVAPVAAQATIWTPYSNGGCANSGSFGGSGPMLNATKQAACSNAISNATINPQCSALGGYWNGPFSGGNCWFAGPW